MQSYSKKVKHFCNILKTTRAFVQVETLQIAGRDVVRDWKVPLKSLVYLKVLQKLVLGTSTS